MGEPCYYTSLLSAMMRPWLKGAGAGYLCYPPGVVVREGGSPPTMTHSPIQHIRLYMEQKWENQWARAGTGAPKWDNQNGPDTMWARAGAGAPKWENQWARAGAGAPKWENQ